MARPHLPRRSFGAVAILVPDYQEAIEYFVGTLGFTLVEDTRLSEEKRWVLVSPGPARPCFLPRRKANANALRSGTSWVDVSSSS